MGRGATLALGMAAVLAQTACHRASRDDTAEDDLPAPTLPLTEDGAVDVSGGALRVIEVPGASGPPVIVRAPFGWLALSTRSLGYAKAPSAWQSVLYRSSDGVHWESVPFDSGHDDLNLTGLAYGAGRFVMVGQRMGREEGASVWTSSDAEDWTERPSARDSVEIWREVTFAGGRFFAYGGFHFMGVSRDGEDWTDVPVEIVQIQGVAHGAGRYLLVGSGPMQISDDGLHFRSIELDCALPGACFPDPSGVIHQGIQTHALFAEGRFFSDQLTSKDGERWEAMPNRTPAAYASGHFLEGGGYALRAFTSSGDLQELPVVRPARAAVTVAGRDARAIGRLDSDEPLPERVDVEFEDGLTCESADCVLVDRQLYLVPPPGTPPLPDRVPRAAGGDSLLSDACPISSMVFCDDYEARSGCACESAAPRDPESCDDVSQYQCEGSFVARDGEWQIDEVAQGGCTCDAVDPNQPPSFGLPCEEGSSGTCQAPLTCLGVQPPPSLGLPAPQPFICTAACASDADCPTWEATGFCAGTVSLSCADGSCQPRSCE